MTAPRPEGDERLDPRGLEAAAKELAWLCDSCAGEPNRHTAQARRAITAYLAAAPVEED